MTESISNDVNEIEVVRVIFRTFESDLTKYGNIITIIIIWLIKLFTIPWCWKGNQYDHVEVLTPEKYRFSIRKEKKIEGIKLTGVYCLPQDEGFYRSYDIKNRKYKLILALQLDIIQKEKLNNFIQNHKGEPYSLSVANWNVLVQKFCFIKSLKKKLLIDDWNNKERKVKRWDCVTLIMRLLVELELLPKSKNNGEKIQLLGLSAFDMAMLLIELCNTKEMNKLYLVSKETMETKDYKEGINLFYRFGSKIDSCRDCFDLKDIEIEIE